MPMAPGTRLERDVAVKALPGRFSAGLELIVNRCLEKDPEERFRSAHDLAIALTASLSQSGLTTRLTIGPAGSRLRRLLQTAAAILGGAALTFAVLMLRGEYPPPGARGAHRWVTFSGRDWSPAMSPDGRYMCLTSDRDGDSRIWVRHTGREGETPLTSGPVDFSRFSPDSTEVLFSRIEGSTRSLYRVDVVGGSILQIAENALYGDWAPEGRRVAFIRPVERDGRLVSGLFVANADGTQVREFARFDYGLDHPRWSPDGATVAAVTLSSA